MAEEETVHMEGDFIFPNGDTYNGCYLSGPVGIKRDGKGKWSSAKVCKFIWERIMGKD